MNLSLKQRIVLSYVIAVISILVLSLINFFYLEDLHRSLMKSTHGLKSESNLVHEVTQNYLSLRQSISATLKMRNKNTAINIEHVENLLKTIEQQLKNNVQYFEDQAIRDLFKKILLDFSSLKELVIQNIISSKAITPSSSETLLTYLDDLGVSLGKLNEEVYRLVLIREQEIDKDINETKRVMLIILIIGFLSLILVAMVIPARVTFPFKKITDAIRELQECNFDVSIYYNQKDEIGELSLELNKMISSIKTFEEFRADRISVENRKFDTLAYSVKKHVIVCDAKGVVTYVNGPLYSLLELSSEDLLHKHYDETLISDSMKEALSIALKRRTKVENAEVFIESETSSLEENVNGEDVSHKISKNIIFQGYATIFPVRGKESSQDYYLMVLSKEI